MSHFLPKKLFVLIFFSIIILVCYSNTFHASWHLDDRPNIVNNYYLHIDSLQPSKLVHTFFTNPHNPGKLSKYPYRPVSCLTFALNWYFGQDQVLGYHLVNIFIHILTAFFLYLFCVNLFNTPNLKNNYRSSPFLIAFIASLLWAVNPIQTQAVTYIVQRMAQLAACFTILGLYAYIKARLGQTFKSRISWLTGCLGCYLLAFNSKPNAAMMPMSVLLLEIIFFQNTADPKSRKKIIGTALLLTVIIILIGSFVFLKGSPLSLLKWYDTRPFTPMERLLSQPRVLLFYLSQIFYPMAHRLSIAHDIVLSSSLLKPWATLPSILIIFLLLGFAIFQITKRPILSFAILFFFLNHIIESSIIALEIIFEHRNYLPSLFLFLPVAYLFSYLLSAFKKKNTVVYTLTLFLIGFLVIDFSWNTYTRNEAWRNDTTLWLDAISKAPNTARAFNNLGIRLAWGDHSTHPHRYDMALKLFTEALGKNYSSTYEKADILGNMALIYFYNKHAPVKAFECFKNALKIHPESLKIRRDFTKALVINKEFECALAQVNILLSKNNSSGRDINLKGFILLWLDRYEDALSCFKKAYPLLANKESLILNTSMALSLSGSYENADALLTEAIKNCPTDLIFYFAAIENSVRSDEKSKVREYATKMFQSFAKPQIRTKLKSVADNPKYPPLNTKLISEGIQTVKDQSF